MAMKTRVVTIFLLLIVSTSLSFAEKLPIKWGKILPEDISMKVYAADPAAPAVVLCDYGTAEVGPRTEYTRHVRIKILKNEGLRYATIELPYRSYDRYEVFTDLRAQTFNVNEKGELVKTKLRGRDIQDIPIDKRNSKRVFTFPDVQVGSIIEYTYTMRSLDLVKLREWYFQTTIPIQWSEYRVYVSKRFNYLVTFQKGHPLNMDEQQSYAERLQWLYSSRIKKARFQLMDNKNILYASPSGSVKVYFAWGESYRFVMNDVPSLHPNQEMLAFSDYFPVIKVHLYLAEGNFPFYYRPILLTANEDYDIYDRRMYHYQWISGYIVYWLPTWDEANKKWLANERLGHRMIKAFDFKPVLDKAMDANGDQMKTALGVYNYVKENVPWDGTYNMYADRDLEKVMHAKSANSGEINLLLIGLLKHAGIEVNPVLIRTRDLGRIENIYPAFHQFNHVIAQVEIAGKIIYLDATGKESSFDKLPWNVDGATGWLLKREGYKWVGVAEPEKLMIPAGLKEI